MNTAAKPYKTRGMVEVARSRANFYDIFPGGCIGRDSMGGRGDCRAGESMRVPASRFGASLTRLCTFIRPCIFIQWHARLIG